MRALGILPFLFFCGVAISLRGRSPVRDTLTISALITALWIVAGCELLGLFHAVAFWPLLIWWVVPTVVLGWKCRAWRPAKPLRTKDWLLLATIAASALVLILIFIQAALTPPNNWDALTYHLPRQIYWMQQRHVGLFPTEDLRMLVMPPFTEYTGLHLMIVSGGDKWVNLIQWFALALTAITASCIARELGCNPRLQALAALLVVSIPIAALEATNPKNDVVTAFFLCASALFGLKAYNSGRFSAALIGAAFGLLLFSKSTGMIFGLPIALWIGAAHARLTGVKRAILWGGAVAAIVFIINVGFISRLILTFGSPFGPRGGQTGLGVENKNHSPRAFLSNFVRNTAMHLATGNDAMDTAMSRAVAHFHKFIRIDLNDQSTTFAASRPFAVIATFGNEDRAKAPFHVLLGIGVSGAALACLFGPRDKWKTTFLLTPLFGLVLFCVLLKWQEWHSRLHVPLLCLTVAVAPYALRNAVIPFGAAALALGLATVTFNDAKPLFDLRRARFRYRDEQVVLGVQEAKRAVQEHRPRVVGIYVRPHRCEYLLLSNLLKREKSPPRFVKLNNAYPQIKEPFGQPDLAICWHRQPAATNVWFYSRYSFMSQKGAVTVFLPRSDQP